MHAILKVITVWAMLMSSIPLVASQQDNSHQVVLTSDGNASTDHIQWPKPEDGGCEKDYERTVLADLQDAAKIVRFVADNLQPGSPSQSNFLYPGFRNSDYIKALKARLDFQANVLTYPGGYPKVIVVMECRFDSDECKQKQADGSEVLAFYDRSLAAMVFCKGYFSLPPIPDDSQAGCAKLTNLMDVNSRVRAMIHEFQHHEKLGCKEDVGTAYGPWCANQLVTGGWNWLTSDANADNYAWLILGEYYSKKCRKDLAIGPKERECNLPPK